MRPALRRERAEPIDEGVHVQRRLQHLHAELLEGLVRAEVGEASRRATMRNHTATHLLHRALRIVLGPQAKQAGSLVAPDRFRFDFLHTKALTDEELREAERIVREQTVRYEPEVADYPRAVSWRREGEDLVVRWTAPEGVRPGMSYKVLVFPEDGEVISLQFEWDVSEARLAEVPLQEGDLAEVNVAVYFSGGYAKSENIPLTW